MLAAYARRMQPFCPRHFESWNHPQGSMPPVGSGLREIYIAESIRPSSRVVPRRGEHTDAVDYLATLAVAAVRQRERQERRTRCVHRVWFECLLTRPASSASCDDRSTRSVETCLPPYQLSRRAAYAGGWAVATVNLNRSFIASYETGA